MRSQGGVVPRSQVITRKCISLRPRVILARKVQGWLIISMLSIGGYPVQLSRTQETFVLELLRLSLDKL